MACFYTVPVNICNIHMSRIRIRITAALSSIDICFSFFADLSADGADHPVLLPHADIHDLQLLAVWSCGVRPHCWVCLFLYRC